jgi:hypothetical protein
MGFLARRPALQQGLPAPDDPANDAEAELIEALLADPRLPHLFLTRDYLQRYIVHISKTIEERDRRLVAAPAVWRQYRLKAHGRSPRAEHDRRFRRYA